MQNPGAQPDGHGMAAVLGEVMSPVPLDTTREISSDADKLRVMGDVDQSGGMPGQPQGETIEPLTGQRLLTMWRNWYAAKEDEQREQQTARRYVNGKQWTANEMAALNKRKQPIVTFNKIRRVITGLVGVEQKLRRDPKAFPRNPNDDDAADLATSALRFVGDQTRFHNIASEVALDAFTSGIGGVYQSVLEKRRQLEVDKTQVKSDRFFYDPRSEKGDFSDARYMGQHGWFEQDALVELMPQAEKYLKGLMGAAMALKTGSGMNSGNDVPTEALIDKEHVWVDGQTNRFFVVEIWYKRKGWWCYAFIVGPTKIAEGVSPFFDVNDKSCHPYQMWTVYQDERLVRYGVVRDLISPQDEINKRRSKLLHLASVRQTASVKGAIEDVDKMRAELAKPDGHVEFNPVNVPTGLPAFQLLQQGDQAKVHMDLAAMAAGELEAAGPNPNVMGRGNENQSGIAIARQQNAGMSELAMVFDNFREWKLRCYRQDWALVQQFWTEERWIRITDDDGNPQFIGVNAPAPQPPMGPPPSANSANGGGFGGMLPPPPGQMPYQQPGSLGMYHMPLDAMMPGQPMQGMGAPVAPMAGGLGGPGGPIIDQQGNPVPMLPPQGGPGMGQQMPPQPVPIMNRIGEIDVDIILDEAPDTVTMQQESIAMLLDLAKQYGPQAAPLPLMLDLVELRPAIKRKLKEGLQQSGQPTPPQMAELEKAKAEIRAINSRANLQEAQAAAVGFNMQIDEHYAGIEGTKMQHEGVRLGLDAEKLSNERMKIAAQMQAKRQASRVEARA